MESEILIDNFPKESVPKDFPADLNNALLNLKDHRVKVSFPDGNLVLKILPEPVITYIKVFVFIILAVSPLFLKVLPRGLSVIVPAAFSFILWRNLKNITLSNRTIIFADEDIVIENKNKLFKYFNNRKNFTRMIYSEKIVKIIKKDLKLYNYRNFLLGRLYRFNILLNDNRIIIIGNLKNKVFAQTFMVWLIKKYNTGQKLYHHTK